MPYLLALLSFVLVLLLPYSPLSWSALVILFLFCLFTGATTDEKP